MRDAHSELARADEFTPEKIDSAKRKIYEGMEIVKE